MRHLLKIQRYILFATITKVVATITKLFQDKVFLAKAFSRPNFFEPKLNPAYPSFKICDKNGTFSARMKKHTAVKWYCNFPVWGLPHPSVEWEPLKNIARGYRWKGSTVLPFKIGLRDLVVDHMPIRYHSQSNSSGKSNVTVNIFVEILMATSDHIGISSLNFPCWRISSTVLCVRGWLEAKFSLFNMEWLLFVANLTYSASLKSRFPHRLEI